MIIDEYLQKKLEYKKLHLKILCRIQKIANEFNKDRSQYYKFYTSSSCDVTITEKNVISDDRDCEFTITIPRYVLECETDIEFKFMFRSAINDGSITIT